MARPAFQITDEVIKQAEKLASRGLTKEEIAHCIGTSYQTLNEKTKMFPEFLEAINRGKSKGIAMMANNLVKLAKKGNAAANIFFLKARAKWKEGDEDTADMINKATESLRAEMKLLREQLDAKYKKEY